MQRSLILTICPQATWKVVSLISARTLEKLNDQIIDVQADDSDDEDEG